MRPSVLRGDVAVEVTQVCIALPLDHAASGGGTAAAAAGPEAPGGVAGLPPQQQVFAFLPLRSYGLRMVVQASACGAVVRGGEQSPPLDPDSVWHQRVWKNYGYGSSRSSQTCPSARLLCVSRTSETPGAM